MLSDAALDAAAAASNRRLPLGGGDLWLDCLPLQHIGGLSILWRCTRAGAGILLHEGFAAPEVEAEHNATLHACGGDCPEKCARAAAARGAAAGISG